MFYNSNAIALYQAIDMASAFYSSMKYMHGIIVLQWLFISYIRNQTINRNSSADRKWKKKHNKNPT